MARELAVPTSVGVAASDMLCNIQQFGRQIRDAQAVERILPRSTAHEHETIEFPQLQTVDKIQSRSLKSRRFWDLLQSRWRTSPSSRLLRGGSCSRLRVRGASNSGVDGRVSVSAMEKTGQSHICRSWTRRPRFNSCIFVDTFCECEEVADLGVSLLAEPAPPTLGTEPSLEHFLFAVECAQPAPFVECSQPDMVYWAPAEVQFVGKIVQLQTVDHDQTGPVAALGNAVEDGAPHR